MASNKKDQMPNLWVASACHMHGMRVHTDAKTTQEVFCKRSVSHRFMGFCPLGHRDAAESENLRSLDYFMTLKRKSELSLSIGRFRFFPAN